MSLNMILNFLFRFVLFPHVLALYICLTLNILFVYVRIVFDC